MVKVTVVQDDKKVFEQEGEFFAGTTIIDSDKDIVDAYVDAVRKASPSRTDYMINLKVLEKNSA